MARGSSAKGGNSKVRLIVFEAEMSDGDLSQVTQAIQNALQPRVQQVRMMPVPAAAMLADGATSIDEEDTTEELNGEQFETVRQPRTRSAKPRVAKTPEVLNDIDFNSEPSLKDFVSEFDLSTTLEKYLVVALWFRDARSTPSISVDHVYTAFKMLAWSTNSNDFAKPLRNLRDQQSMKGGAREGFTLTLPGAGKIEAKRRTP